MRSISHALFKTWYICRVPMINAPMFCEHRPDEVSKGIGYRFGVPPQWTVIYAQRF